MKPENMDRCLSRPVGIFGAGVSGRAVKGLVESLGAEAVIYDENPNSGAASEFSPDRAGNHALMINSPGFPPSHPWFRIAAQAGCRVIGEIEFASYYWKGKTFFVTGTNGKSTITRLLASVLIHAGYDAYAFGNIGIPFSEHYQYSPRENAVAVIELSSFQAWNLHASAVDGIIWSNFAEDHLDWHGEMARYFDAKWNALCQVNDGPIVLGEGVLDYARKFKKPIPLMAEIVEDRTDRFEPGGGISAVNKLNIEYVKRFVQTLGIGVRLVDQVVSQFVFLPHRLEFIGSAHGVSFWNDSKATNFHAVEAALESFYEPVIWLGGGLGKGGDVVSFARRIAPRMQKAIVFGEVASALSDALVEEGVLTYAVENMKDGMAILKMECQPGSHVVLSPGFASFDQFNGYADRGAQFRELVRENFITHYIENPAYIAN